MSEGRNEKKPKRQIPEWCSARGREVLSQFERDCSASRLLRCFGNAVPVDCISQEHLSDTKGLGLYLMFTSAPRGTLTFLVAGKSHETGRYVLNNFALFNVPEVSYSMKKCFSRHGSDKWRFITFLSEKRCFYSVKNYFLDVTFRKQSPAPATRNNLPRPTARIPGSAVSSCD